MVNSSKSRMLMKNKEFEEFYDWNKLSPLFDEFVPQLIDLQNDIDDSGLVVNLPDEKRTEIENIGFSEEPRDPRDVANQMLNDIYPYRMKTNSRRFFGFIPNAISPYSVFGDFLNSFVNPYGGGFTISAGIAVIEKETINFLGKSIGYDVKPVGGTFVSGGSNANLTAAIVARDNKVNPHDISKAVVYVSDQTHSSMAKGLHIVGISPENIVIIPSDNNFRMDIKELKNRIKNDISKGLKPFMVVASAGTTNTGSIDPLNEIADICKENNLWMHVDGAYGASILLSSHKDLLKGIEKSDSVTWDGHKWLYQTYGCAAIVVKNNINLLKSFHAHPEYLKDVESTEEEFNFWDMGIELTRPMRGAKLWFTMQTLGLENFRRLIDQGFVIGKKLQKEVEKYDDFEIICPSNIGILNFRYYNDKFSESELDRINQNISERAIKNNKTAFLTTILKGKTVLRFCCNHALTSEEDIKDIVGEIRKYIDEEIK